MLMSSSFLQLDDMFNSHMTHHQTKKTAIPINIPGVSCSIARASKNFLLHLEFHFYSEDDFDQRITRLATLYVASDLSSTRWVGRQLISGTDVDKDPSPAERAEIGKLIALELRDNQQTTLHPSIPELPEPRFSALVQNELERKDRNEPMAGGVDLSKYEAPEAPTSDSGKEHAEILEDWDKTLRRAYTASSHLSGRRENLSLLETHGKNAWLISNAQLEEMLRKVEKELQETKETTEALHKERKIRQDTSKGELLGLDDAWKRHVSSVIDVEIAAENLKQEILERRRQQARA